MHSTYCCSDRLNMCVSIGNGNRTPSSAIRNSRSIEFWLETMSISFARRSLTRLSHMPSAFKGSESAEAAGHDGKSFMVERQREARGRGLERAWKVGQVKFSNRDRRQVR